MKPDFLTLNESNFVFIEYFNIFILSKSFIQNVYK